MAPTKRPEPTKKKPTAKPPAPNGRSKPKLDQPALKLVPKAQTLLADGKTKPNADAMRDAAKVLGIAAPKARGAAADTELLGALRIELGKRLAPLTEEESVICSVCKEVSTDDTDFCPYCGDYGKPSEDDSHPAEVVSGVPSGARRATPLPDKTETPVPDDFRDAYGGGEDPEPVADDSNVSDDDLEGADQPDDEPDELQVQEARKSSRPPKPVPPSRKKKGVGIAAHAAEPTRDVDGALVATAQELDTRLQRIHVLKRTWLAMGYDMGLECKEIRDRQLFKARGYSSFKEFAIKELPFTRENALQLMSIVEQYSRDDYEVVGFTKLRVISAVSDSNVKQELLEAAKQGVSRRELERRASASVLPPARGTKAPPAAEPGEKITLIGKVGSRPRAVRFHDVKTGEVLESAGTFKSIKGETYGELEISEGVFIRIGLRINSASKALEGLTVRFVRASEDE